MGTVPSTDSERRERELRAHAVERGVHDAQVPALARMEHVVSFEFPATDMLLVRTRKPDAFYRELPQIVSDTKLEVHGLESPDDSLDAVFRYLVG